MLPVFSVLSNIKQTSQGLISHILLRHKNPRRGFTEPLNKKYPCYSWFILHDITGDINVTPMNGLFRFLAVLFGMAGLLLAALPAPGTRREKRQWGLESK
jgi:hypothetical protein